MVQMHSYARYMVSLLLVALVYGVQSKKTELQLIRRSLATSGAVDLVNKKATQFLAPVSMDGKTFHVLVDTGSSDLWFGCDSIAPEKCINSTCPSKLKQILYGSGSVCLEPNSGTFRMGSLEFSNALYGIGVKSSVLTEGNQGILGLSFPSISVFTKSNDTKQYPIQHLDSFSMYLTPKEDESGSKLILNGIDDELIAKEKLLGYTIPLNETAHWTIEISQLQIENDIQNNFTKPCSSSNCLAIIDSGTTFLSMPSLLFKRFALAYLKPGTTGGCTFNTQLQYYVCPKDIALPKLTLVLGKDKKFILNSWDYSWVYSETEIAVQLQRNPSSGSLADRWILGETFLKVYYTEYLVDKKAVTFYCKNGGVCAGGENILDFSGKKPTWAVVLMISGGVLLFIGILGGILYCCRRRRQNQADDKRQPLDGSP